MPQATDMINLGFLSEYEQELILEVLHRDEELRQAEEQRVRWEESTSCDLYLAIVLFEFYSLWLVIWPNNCKTLLIHSIQTITHANNLSQF